MFIEGVSDKLHREGRGYLADEITNIEMISDYAMPNEPAGELNSKNSWRNGLKYGNGCVDIKVCTCNKVYIRL